MPFASDDSIRAIFQFFLDGHFKQLGTHIQELSKGLIAVIIKLYRWVYPKLKKHDINLHYEFYIRHITGVFQGILMTTVEKFKEPEKIVKLLIHESQSLFVDRFVSLKDINTLRWKIGNKIIKIVFDYIFNYGKYLTDISESIIFYRFFYGHLIMYTIWKIK